MTKTADKQTETTLRKQNEGKSPLMVKITLWWGSIVMSPLQKKVCTQMTTTAMTCSNFGTNHHVKHPTAFFCTSSCDLWDKRDVANSRMNHEMKKYKCTAQHSLFYNNPQQQQQAGYRDIPWSRRHNQLQPVSPPWSIRWSTKVTEAEDPFEEKNKEEEEQHKLTFEEKKENMASKSANETKAQTTVYARSTYSWHSANCQQKQ